MNTILKLSVILGLIYSSSGIMAQTRMLPLKKSIPLSKVFVVPHGYDSNDKIELLVDGFLPGPCWESADTKVELQKFSKKIIVKQFIQKKDSKTCMSDPSIPTWPISFVTKHTINNLDAGDYTVIYNKERGVGETKFHVKKATREEVDDSFYAPVSTAFIPEMVYETDNGEVILTGVLPTNCMKLHNSDIVIERFEDTIVIMPILKLPEGPNCPYSPTPLNTLVQIGPLKEGRYMLHVRSMAGQFLSKIFSVRKRPLDPRRASL